MGLDPRTVLIAGGAGFVGSNLAVTYKKNNPHVRVISVDNLKRRGSELALSRLGAAGVEFVHADIRCRDDLEELPKLDLLIDCSAEPSVQAGLSGAPDYLLQTNLVGTINLLELARRNDAAFLFLSTSRVYPLDRLNRLPIRERETRLEWADVSAEKGLSAAGVSERFPLEGPRSLYGASKLSGELLLQEYAYSYGMPAMINRCGVLTGPWQMGRVDQGFVTLWVSRHIFPDRPLSYLGYGGTGKQVRDILHIDDLADLIEAQLRRDESWDATPFNIGGGVEVSISLAELTALCRSLTGVTRDIGSQPETSSVDIPIYVSDCGRAERIFGWQPQRDAKVIVTDVVDWIRAHETELKKVF
jgi:CDP-paratose 2-epimerase